MAKRARKSTYSRISQLSDAEHKVDAGRKSGLGGRASGFKS